jgi:ribosomal protein L33
MLKFCPNCNDEREIRHGLCMECGEELFVLKKKKRNDWEEEDEWTESDWGQDTLVEGGDV